MCVDKDRQKEIDEGKKKKYKEKGKTNITTNQSKRKTEIKKTHHDERDTIREIKRVQM